MNLRSFKEEITVQNTEQAKNCYTQLGNKAFKIVYE